MDPNDQEEDGANIDLDSQRKGKCAVIKTSTRQVFLHYTNETLSRICNWKCQHGANTLQESGWCLNDGHWLWSSVVSMVWMVLMCVLSKVNGSSTISTLLLLFYFHYYYYYVITTLSLHWMCEFHSQYLLFACIEFPYRPISCLLLVWWMLRSWSLGTLWYVSYSWNFCCLKPTGSRQHLPKKSCI